MRLPQENRRRRTATAISHSYLRDRPIHRSNELRGNIEMEHNPSMLTKQEIADAIVDLNEDYTGIYHKTFKKDMDKQLWAALHVGFIAAMKLNGYSDSILNAALEDAQHRLPDQTCSTAAT
jgi:hypothetical protein